MELENIPLHWILNDEAKIEWKKTIKLLGGLKHDLFVLLLGNSKSLKQLLKQIFDPSLFLIYSLTYWVK